MVNFDKTFVSLFSGGERSRLSSCSGEGDRSADRF